MVNPTPPEPSPVRYIRSRGPTDAGLVLAMAHSMDDLEDEPWDAPLVPGQGASMSRAGRT